MAVIVFAIFFIVLALVAAFLPAQWTVGSGRKTDFSLAKRIAAGFFVLVAGLILLSNSCHQVENGHVGLVYEFGAIKGQTGDGLVFTAPWRSVKEANVQVQKLSFTDQRAEEGAKKVGDGLDSFSKESQNVFIDATLNIRVDPANIQNLYCTVGENYVEKLISSRINQVFKDETVNYSTVDIAPNRDIIKANVERRMREELETYSISVVGLFIDNIAFSADFEAAIEAKQVATQDAQREQERIKQREAEAQQAIARAHGEAEALRITAEGQAQANALLNASLSEQLIQFQAVQKLADNIQIALIPSGQGVIIDPASLLGR